MKNLLLILALAAAAIAGCSRSTHDRNEAVPVTPSLTVEETARLMLEALKQGDVETFLSHADLRGIYNGFPKPMRRTFSYEQYTAALEKAGRKAHNEKMAELAYDVLGVEDKGDLKIVTIKTRTRPTKSWKTFQVTFGNFDGTWKITGDGVKKLTTTD